MIFKEINYDEFWEFAKDHSQFNVLQSIEHAKRTHNKYQYLALLNNNIIVAAGLYLYRPVFLGYYEVNSQMGPLLDYNNKEIVTTYFDQLAKYLRSKKVFKLIINPNVLKVQRDIDGQIVDQGFSNYHIVELLKQNNFKEIDIDNHPYLIKWYYTKDLSSIHSDEALFESFNNKTQYAIRKTIEDGLQIKEIHRNEMREFISLMNEAADKHHFANREDSFYYRIYDEFVPTNHGKFMVVYLQKASAITRLLNKINAEQQLIDNTPETSKKNRGIIKEAQIRLDAAKQRIEKINTLADIDGNIYLAGSFFYIYPNEMIYFNSGSSRNGKIFQAPYLLQYEAMKYAINHHIPRYNFYGTYGKFNGKPEQHGVYEFKRGFNGVIEETIGYYELVTNKSVSKIIYLIKKVLRKI